MQKWEYHTEAWARDRQVADALIPLGEGGWELVSIYVNSAGNNVFIFKRPKR